MKKIIFIFLNFFLTIMVKDIIYTEPFKEESKSFTFSYDIIGKINIPGTNINTYITKTSNNTYYLNHNYKKEKDKLGSVFIDYRNNLDDKKLLIYGHNSNRLEKAPFKDLEKYKDHNFFSKHPYIYINIFNDKLHLYKIFSINITKEGDYRHTKINFKNNEYITYLKDLQKNSLYNTLVSVVEHDYTITLQTCNYDIKNSYLLINAKRVL